MADSAIGCERHFSPVSLPVDQKEALMDRFDAPSEAEIPIESVAPAIQDSGVRPRNPAADVLNVARGFCMGAADTVPGVSGGTVALVLGHYQRLVTAISHVDRQLLTLIRSRRFAEASRYVDLRFMTALGIGIAMGVATLSGLMHWLLEYRTSQTLAVFFGLMIASVWIVKGYIDRWSLSRVVALIVGAAAAVVITILPTGTGEMSLPYLFFSASLAICAMILPGISGAFVLLLLGVYHGVTGLIKDAVRGNITVETMTQMVVFGSGCVVGLLAFSKVLRWLLEHHRDVTMAGLMGLMIGSVGKLWPLQQPTAETASAELKFRVMEFVSPTNWDGNLWSLAGLAIGAAVAVLVVEKVAEGQ